MLRAFILQWKVGHACYQRVFLTPKPECLQTPTKEDFAKVFGSLKMSGSYSGRVYRNFCDSTCGLSIFVVQCRKSAGKLLAWRRNNPVVLQTLNLGVKFHLSLELISYSVYKYVMRLCSLGMDLDALGLHSTGALWCSAPHHIQSLVLVCKLVQRSCTHFTEEVSGGVL